VNRVTAQFDRLRAENRRGLAPFVVAGRPGLDRLGAMLRALEAAGATMVEIGVPFSDPIADGPVIAAAMHRALAGGVTTTGVFDAIARARQGVTIPLVAMVSVSIVLRLDAEAFCRRAAESGVDGLIVPDAPVDEAKPIRAAAAAAGLTYSHLIGPATTGDRLARIVEASTGFIYLLARTGVTGERAEAPEIAGRVRDIRTLTDLPIACGFGISSPEQVGAVVRHADAAIVGSALVRRIEEAIEAGVDAGKTAADVVGRLAGGLDSADS